MGGFKTRQKQFFHLFGAREKIRKKFFHEKSFFFSEKSIFYREKSVFIGKNRYLLEKSAIFLRFFYFRFFLPKIVSNPTKNQFFVEKSAEKNDFFVLAYDMESNSSTSQDGKTMDI